MLESSGLVSGPWRVDSVLDFIAGCVTTVGSEKAVVVTREEGERKDVGVLRGVSIASSMVGTQAEMSSLKLPWT